VLQAEGVVVLQGVKSWGLSLFPVSEWFCNPSHEKLWMFHMNPYESNMQMAYTMLWNHFPVANVHPVVS
jgi:hypothetical protein